MSLTRDLARLIRSKPVTDRDLEWASLFVLDTLGCALGAIQTAPAKMLHAVASPDGTNLREMRREAKGDPENPVTAVEVAEKARLQLREAGLSDSRIENLIGAVLNLPSNCPVRDLELFAEKPIYQQTRVTRSA